LFLTFIPFSASDKPSHPFSPKTWEKGRWKKLTQNFLKVGGEGGSNPLLSYVEEISKNSKLLLSYVKDISKKKFKITSLLCERNLQKNSKLLLSYVKDISKKKFKITSHQCERKFYSCTLSNNSGSQGTGIHKRSSQSGTYHPLVQVVSSIVDGSFI
jgi:predicted transcriptional regulator